MAKSVFYITDNPGFLIIRHDLPYLGNCYPESESQILLLDSYFYFHFLSIFHFKYLYANLNLNTETLLFPAFTYLDWTQESGTLPVIHQPGIYLLLWSSGFYLCLVPRHQFSGFACIAGRITLLMIFILE